MKFKYFLRGVGVGMVFASVISLAAFRQYTPQMSDEQVIERAKELGMVEKQDKIKDLLENQSSTQGQRVSETGMQQEDENEEEKLLSSEKITDSESGDVTGTEQKTDITQTSERDGTRDTEAYKELDSGTPKSSTENRSTEKNSTQKGSVVTTQESVSVTLTIQKGDSSYPVCQKLEKLGMIEDAAEFDDYLIEHGYSSRIKVGSHTLTKGMDYSAIAKEISTKK